MRRIMHRVCTRETMGVTLMSDNGRLPLSEEEREQIKYLLRYLGTVVLAVIGIGLVLALITSLIF
jgi:hypothetical protein